MKLELLILTGPDAGRRLGLGQAAMVLGRSPQATLPFPEDSFLSSAHAQFLALQDGSGVRVKDLGSTNGTFLNKHQIQDVVAVPGDIVQVGSLSLRIVTAVAPSLEGEPVLSDTTQPAGLEGTDLNDLWATLTAGDVPLFCVLDAAADAKVLEHLQRQGGHTVQSLYEGSGAQDLSQWAPYLVALPPDSLLLRSLLLEGWGKAWGSFCTAHISFAELRRHLRRFLMVQLQEGSQVYFRFYDPRVLREFLPTATHAELLHFFGPVQEWLIEGAHPQSLLRNRCTSDGLITEALPVGLPTRETTSSSFSDPTMRQIS